MLDCTCKFLYTQLIINIQHHSKWCPYTHQHCYLLKTSRLLLNINWMCRTTTKILTAPQDITQLLPWICRRTFKQKFKPKSWINTENIPNWEAYACLNSIIRKSSLYSNEQGNCCQICENNTVKVTITIYLIQQYCF